MELSLTETILKLIEHTAPPKKTTWYPHQSRPFTAGSGTAGRCLNTAN